MLFLRSDLFKASPDQAEAHRQYAEHHAEMYHQQARDPEHRAAAEAHQVAMDAHLSGHPKAEVAGIHALRASAKAGRPSGKYHSHFRSSSAEKASKEANRGALSTSGSKHREAARLHRVAAGSIRVSHDPYKGIPPFEGKGHIRYHTMRAVEHDHQAQIAEASGYANKNKNDPQSHKDVISAVKEYQSLPHGNPDRKAKVGKLIGRHQGHLDRLSGSGVSKALYLFLKNDLLKADKPKQKTLLGPTFDPTSSGFRSGRGQLQACPYGGGKKCIERGGDGAEKHYAGYVHPRDLAEHQARKEEDKDEGLADKLEPEDGGGEPEQSLFVSEAKKKGIRVESYLNAWDLEDRGFDDVVSELFGTDNVDSLLDAYQIEQGDIESELEYIEVHAGLGKVMGSFLDRDRDRQVGLYERHFSYDHNDDMIVVEHAYFRLDDDVKGTGVGKTFLKKSIEQYLSMGVGKITTHPTWDGRYVWAKFGFDWGEGGADYVRATFPEFLHEEFGVDPDSAEEIADEMADKPWKLAALNLNGKTIPVHNVESGETENCKAGEAYLKTQHGDEVWSQEWGDEGGGGVMYLNTGDDGFMHLMDYLGIGTKKKRKKRKAS